MSTAGAWRRTLGGCAVATALLTSACGSSAAALSDQPHDHDSGRALARTVADQANCGDLEDYSLVATDHWDFTCQMGDDMFLIRAASSASSRDKGLPGVADRRVPYKAGQFFLVSPFQKPGGSARADSLSAFPGDLVNPL